MEITFAVLLWGVRIAFLVLLYLFLIRVFSALQRSLATENAVAARPSGLAHLVDGLGDNDPLGILPGAFPDAVGTEFYKRCHRAVETQQPDQFEVFYKPWGRWVDTRIYPSKAGLAIYRADISEMMEQQKRLRENEQRLYVAEERVRLALEAADVGTFDYYPAVGVIRWSDRCNELFDLPAGTKPDYITYLNAIYPDDRHIIHETMREVLSPGSSGHYEIQYRALGVANSRERWLEEKGRVLLDDAGRLADTIAGRVDFSVPPVTTVIEVMVTQELGDPFRRDALKRYVALPPAPLDELQ